MRYDKFVRNCVFALGALAAAGCSDGGGSGTGTVSISLMDRPVDGVTELNVTFSEVRIKPQGDGPPIPLEMTESPMTVNLLAHDDQNAAILVDGIEVEAGSYNWVEFTVDDANVAYSNAMLEDGRMMPVDVEVPSGRIRLVNGFEVGENQAVEFLFDWNVRAGLTWAVGRDVLLLRPAFRVLYANEYGSISGAVLMDTAMNGPGCMTEDPTTKVVYVFEGDIDLDAAASDGTEPYTTVDAEDADNDGDFEYRVVAMPDLYTLGFACETEADMEPDSFLPPAAGNPVEVADAATPVEGVDF